jgi:EmrB/QacA subfamily drug resistance transporter
MGHHGGVTDPANDGLRHGTAAARWVIAATVMGSGMAALDSTVVGIALPAIGHDFHANVAGLQWIVTGYLLTLAGLLLLGGALGDRFGRRRLFLIGITWFALASALCGLAPNTGVLVAARGFQGVGSALLTPGSLAILEASFVPEDRGRAIGAWSAFGGVATAIGPFLGGYLIGAISWRLIFFINLPVAAAVLTLGIRHVPESRDVHAPRRIDIGGAALATVGLIGMTYGIIEGPPKGWTSVTVVSALVLGVAAIGGFVAAEARERHPLLPLGIFGSSQFTASNVVTFIVYGALGGALFLLPIELQNVSHYSATEAGAALLPVTFVMFALSAQSGALAGRIGPRLQMSVGPVVVGAGMALLARLGVSGHAANYIDRVLPAIIVFGLGLAITVAPLTATVLGAVEADHAGIASAVNNDVARTAGLLAVAVLPVAAGLTGSSYLHAAAFAHGFRTAVLLSAGACALGGLVALLTIRNPRRVPPRAGSAVPGLPAHLHCALEGPPLRGRTRVRLPVD